MVIVHNARNIGTSTCKVGACRKCGSSCKHYKCSCDGISSIDAVVQVRVCPVKQKKGKKKETPKRIFETTTEQKLNT